MTARQIADRIQQEADARLGDTVERLLSILRNRHTHQCWRKECSCEYCQFINGKYIDAKMALHKVKRRIRNYEYMWLLTDDETNAMMKVEMKAAVMKNGIKHLREHKKDLQTNVI